MSPREKAPTSWRRIASLATIGLAAALGVTLLAILPDLGVLLLPDTFRRHPGEWLGLAALVGLGLAHAAGPGRGRRLLDVVDVQAARLLDGRLATALGLFCLALLATWAPHYLTWPWNRDNDTFATIAQLWDAGVRPYRDIRAYNFPGQTYLFWIIGKTFGWGRLRLVYVVDVAGIVLLGVTLVAWSRRRLGGPLPGLVAFLAFLQFYLGLLGDMVIQRDWQTALGVSLAILTLQAWPGRRGRVVSALATAIALTIRPQAVLFLPALGLAVALGAADPDAGGRRVLRGLGEWALAFALFSTLGFAPILASGLTGDFLRGLRIPAYGGPYSRSTPAYAIGAFLGQFEDGWLGFTLILTLLAAALAPRDLRRLAWPWALAWAGAAIYRPISPVHHNYLLIPIHLIAAIAAAFPVAWLLSLRRIDAPVRLLVLALFLYEMTPTVPRFSMPAESWRAIGRLARGEDPDRPPPGAWQMFSGDPHGLGEWKDYNEVLAYLRAHTGPRTAVANVLNRYPFEPVNGPTGRVSPFRCESGICWLSWVAIDLDPEFAASLEATPDSVVVWEPDQVHVDVRMKLDRLLATIRRLYEPEARFGAIEVWRRKR